MDKIDNLTVEAILKTSRKNNQKNTITGMLLASDRSFFQILEGPETNIVVLADIIKQDIRHSNMVEIIREFIPKRAFENWSMGFAKVSEQQLQTIEGLNDFFEQKKCLEAVRSGRAKKLLAAFADGLWY